MSCTATRRLCMVGLIGVSAVLWGLDAEDAVMPNGLKLIRGGCMLRQPAHAHRAGVPLEVHAPTVARMREHYGKRGVELNDARLRMATLPASAEVAALQPHMQLGTQDAVVRISRELAACMFILGQRQGGLGKQQRSSTQLQGSDDSVVAVG